MSCTLLVRMTELSRPQQSDSSLEALSLQQDAASEFEASPISGASLARLALGSVDTMSAHTSTQEQPAKSERQHGESIIDQSPTRTVGDRVYVSVPGPIPMVRVRRRKK